MIQLPTIAQCARLTLLTPGEVDELCAYAVTHQVLAEAVRDGKDTSGIERSLKVLRKEIKRNA